MTLDSGMSIEKKGRIQKNILWILIATIVMIFASLTSAYVVRKETGEWMYFEIPQTFLYSTIVILISSLTLILAWIAAKKNNYNGIIGGLVSTGILAIVFTKLQLDGWKDLFDQGVVFGGNQSNPSGSFFILFVFLHLIHLAGGFIALLITIYKGFKKKYNSENKTGIELCSIYWHFLGGLWLYLFIFLHLIR